MSILTHIPNGLSDLLKPKKQVQKRDLNVVSFRLRNYATLCQFCTMTLSCETFQLLYSTFQVFHLNYVAPKKTERCYTLNLGSHFFSFKFLLSTFRNHLDLLKIKHEIMLIILVNWKQLRKYRKNWNTIHNYQKLSLRCQERSLYQRCVSGEQCWRGGAWCSALALTVQRWRGVVGRADAAAFAGHRTFVVQLGELAVSSTGSQSATSLRCEQTYIKYFSLYL